MANAPLPVARSHCSWQHLFFLRIQSSRDNPQQTQLACSTNSVSLSPHLCESVIRFCRHESVWISGYNPGNHFRSRQSRMIHLKTNTPNTCSHAKCSCRTLPMKRKRCRCKGRLRQSVHHSLVAALASLQAVCKAYERFTDGSLHMQEENLTLGALNNYGRQESVSCGTMPMFLLVFLVLWQVSLKNKIIGTPMTSWLSN